MWGGGRLNWDCRQMWSVERRAMRFVRAALLIRRSGQGSNDPTLPPRVDASEPFVSATEPGLVSILPKIDGRRLRSERTRQALIEAFMRLLCRNPRMPTSSQIAHE